MVFFLLSNCIFKVIFTAGVLVLTMTDFFSENHFILSCQHFQLITKCLTESFMFSDSELDNTYFDDTI